VAEVRVGQAAHIDMKRLNVIGAEDGSVSGELRMSAAVWRVS
jgi:hypothetical protein